MRCVAAINAAIQSGVARSGNPSAGIFAIAVCNLAHSDEAIETLRLRQLREADQQPLIQ